MNSNIIYCLVSLFVLHQVSIALASDGDRSPFYQNCVRSCLKVNCTKDGRKFTNKSIKHQDLSCKLLSWSCRDECRYSCMWKTVDGFLQRNFELPKFHGKWPFIRIWGVQEPASALFSVLNLAAHLYMNHKIRKRFVVRTTPIVLFWHVFTGVCVNAWTWSTIFHTRDTPFTEFMDYASALSMVMALFLAAVVRVFHRRRVLTSLVVLSTALYYCEHARYLYTGAIDYDYNMLVNVVVGVVGSLIWLWWSVSQLLAGRRHASRLVWFTLLSGASLSLELLDFPPSYYVLDAHALWHLSTAPLPLLFYRFVIDDISYLQNSLLGKVDEKNALKIT